jgi:hypothetical protein
MAIRLLLILLASWSTLLGAATYKCQDAAGRVVYTDRPCEAGQTATRPLGTGTAAAPVQSVPVPAPVKQAPAPYRRPQPVTVPPLPPAPDLSALPKDAQGRSIAAQSGGAEIALARPDKRTPLNVLAACSGLVTGCVKPGERELDACMMSAPRCASDRPWDDPAYTPCCPVECWRQYEGRRIAGVPPLSAFDATLFGRGESATGGQGCIAVR